MELRTDLLTSSTTTVAALKKQNSDKPMELLIALRSSPAHMAMRMGELNLLAWVNSFIYYSQLNGESLAADLDSFVEGRRLDDNAHVLLRFEGGAKGMLWCSQVAPGHENGLRIRIYGDRGGIEWVQGTPTMCGSRPLAKLSDY